MSALRQRFAQLCNSLRNRILVAFLLMLTAVELIAYGVLSLTTHEIVQRQVSSDLGVAERLFERQMAYNRDRLTEAARLLSSDFGFRDAIATQDEATIASVLENHGNRIGAGLMMLAGGDGRLVASKGDVVAGQDFPFPRLLAEAQRDGSSSSLVLYRGRGYQLVIVPVLAPLPIAWVATGFIVDDHVAADLKDLTALDLSFVSRVEPDGWQVLASTLAADTRSELPRWLAAVRIAGDHDETFRSRDDIYPTRLHRVSASGAGEITAVLQRSLTTALAPYRRLQQTLLVLAGISLLLSALLSYFIAGSITNPLARLTRSAQRMREGHYDEPIQLRQADEIGVLADSLNHMREGIAAREREILRLAYFDPLTGLPNRLRFNRELTSAITRAAAAERCVTVMMLDIDRFRIVNGTLGHGVGDEVLCEVAERLRAALSQDMPVARLGGDEFGIVIPLSGLHCYEAVVADLLSYFDQPMASRGQSLDVSASIGVALYPHDGLDPETLIRHADTACFAAKRTRSGHARFNAVTMATQQTQLSLLGELRHAVEYGELCAYYQPRVSLFGNRLEGVEALVRWKHPQRGLVNPAEFIPFAEQTGYIRTLTRCMIVAALSDCGRWLHEGLRIPVAVNLSARDLHDANLPVIIEHELQTSGVPAPLLTLEITESVLMEDPQAALANLSRLDALGVRLAIDDYGTGYSSLAYVKRLPVDELKIDQTFVREVAANPRDRAIVASTIDLAHNLGMTVTAEGIEDPACYEQLRRLGCDHGQGYWISKPLSTEALRQWLQEAHWIVPQTATARERGEFVVLRAARGD